MDNQTVKMIKTRTQLEREESAVLAPYAMKSQNTAGRVHSEHEDEFRLPFQRDRDRIVHSKSFRRLQAKTQVFVAYYGDHYRDRLTHSIEVSQIARGLSRTLGLNEDLAEAISLAHDLGHTPFGHGGEDILDEIMKKFGLGFEHNEQSRRILEKLERVNPDFDGLNLSKEVLDGMLKHNPHSRQAYSEFENYPHLEAQIADTADEIAYINHDLDDGIRSGLIEIDQIAGFDLWQMGREKALAQYGEALAENDDESRKRHISRIISKMIGLMIRDLQSNTNENLINQKIESVENVRTYKGKLVTFSGGFQPKVVEIRSFLLRNFYNHEKVAGQIEKGKKIIAALFDYFMKNPEKMPQVYVRLIKAGDRKEVAVKDYIAGMTDRFAEEQFKSLA